MRPSQTLCLMGVLLALTGLMPSLACHARQADSPLPLLTSARPDTPPSPTPNAQGSHPLPWSPSPPLAQGDGGSEGVGRPTPNLPEPAPDSPVICIDPGHPSEVSNGLEVQNGTTETHIDWVVAVALKQILVKQGYKVVMTKSGEKEMVKNKERALIANRAHAALMVRLHCDSSTDRGYALYYPDRQGTTQGKTGPTADIRKRSKQAAEALDAGMAKVLDGILKNGGVRGDSRTAVGGKQGALTGSIFSEVPVVTIEMVVLNNKGDAAFIKTESGQQQMALAIADGIARYVPAQKRSTD